MLEARVRAPTSEQRDVFRARIVLLAAEGRSTRSIARELGTMPRTVSLWRGRYAREGLAGLRIGRGRAGAPGKYDATTGRRILAVLERPPPAGYARWTGALIAAALGDVTNSRSGASCAPRRSTSTARKSWCESDDPEFAAKAAEIVGLYLDPPEDALVLAVDEKPHIQALERAQGYLKLPNGRALSGHSHDYKRHGTTTLFAALDVATGEVKAGHYQAPAAGRVPRLHEPDRRRPPGPARSTSSSTISTPTSRSGTAGSPRHHNVRFHFTPTHASWLNQVEIWFSILAGPPSRRQLHLAQLREHIDAFVESYNARAKPFSWTAATVHQKHLGTRVSHP